jgi:HD-GYP domain-containing protein (c-di-GMP phosphodiesterase class II)
MRYIHVSQIREEMILGTDLYSTSGSLLLRHGQVLTNIYIDKILSLGITGIYINEEVTQDIIIEPVVRERIRINTVCNLRNLYMTATKKGKEAAKQFDDTVDSLKEMVDSIFYINNPVYDVRDFKVAEDYSFYHSVNLAIISMIIGTGLNMTRGDLNYLGMSAAFANIGMTAVNPNIMEKKISLTKAEFEEIKRHPLIGFNVLNDKYKAHARVMQGVLQHHERWNGNGYPEGLKGKDISVYARIIAIADVYDALVSNRPYRNAVMPFEAVEFIMANGGILFDPELVQIFTRKVAAYPIGTTVLLSDNSLAVVKENNFDCNLRPIVKVINSPSGIKYINLKEDKGALNLTISSTCA